MKQYYQQPLFKVSLILFLGLSPFINKPVHAETPEFVDHRPMLLEDKNYRELWEQFFIFDDGTLYSSQFLIGNFPFMKHHIFLQSSLILPDGKRIIIQNGRGTGKWSFDKNNLDIKMFDDISHHLKGRYPHYSLNIKNNSASIDLKLKSLFPAEAFKKPANPKNKRILASLYAPLWEVTGKWHEGDNKSWINLPKGQGFGLHTLIQGKTHKIAKDFIRIFGVNPSSQGNKNKIIMISTLHQDDKRLSNIFLFLGNEKISGFKNINLNLKNIETSNDSSVPKLYQITAQNSKGLLTGTVKFTKKYEYFLLNNHLSMIEKIIARVFPTFHRYRYQIEYDLTYDNASKISILKGTGFGEYINITPPSFKKKRRRKR